MLLAHDCVLYNGWRLLRLKELYTMGTVRFEYLQVATMEPVYVETVIMLSICSHIVNLYNQVASNFAAMERVIL